MSETIHLEPDWESVCSWFARAMAEQAFEKFAYQPVASFMEQVRYLAKANPEALDRVIEDMYRRHRQLNGGKEA